jgi:Uma2 family endonuclease
MTAKPPPTPPITRAQYYELGRQGYFDGKRVELIRGEVVEMSPIDWPHVLGTSKAREVLRVAFAGIGEVIEQGPYPVGDSDPIPDVRVVPGRLADYSDHPSAALVVVEVADTTLQTDLTEKAELYATAGVTDYWVLDLNARQLHVLRDPQTLSAALGATAYQTHAIHGPDDTVAPLAAPHASVRVADLLP